MSILFGATTRCPWCRGCGVTRNGEPCGSCRGAGFTDGSVAPVRRDDPETSRAASKTVNVTRGQRLVLSVLKVRGPMTDEDIYDTIMEQDDGTFSLSPSGARTRRHELEGLGLVVDSGRRETLPSGRKAVVWAAR